MPTYQFQFQWVDIHQTRSSNSDTDYAGLAVTVGTRNTRVQASTSVISVPPPAIHTM